jgi:hypothetical protein
VSSIYQELKRTTAGIEARLRRVEGETRNQGAILTQTLHESVAPSPRIEDDRPRYARTPLQLRQRMMMYYATRQKASMCMYTPDLARPEQREIIQLLSDISYAADEVDELTIRMARVQDATRRQDLALSAARRRRAVPDRENPFAAAGFRDVRRPNQPSLQLPAVQSHEQDMQNQLTRASLNMNEMRIVLEMLSTRLEAQREALGWQAAEVMLVERLGKQGGPEPDLDLQASDDEDDPPTTGPPGPAHASPRDEPGADRYDSDEGEGDWDPTPRHAPPRPHAGPSAYEPEPDMYRVKGTRWVPFTAQAHQHTPR